MTRYGLYYTGGKEPRTPRAACQRDALALGGLPAGGGWPRCTRETRIALASVLVVLVLAKLAGMQSLQGASDWNADQEALLREGLQLSWKRMPCANTYSSALARLDSQHVNEALAAWCVRKEAESRCGEDPSRLAMQASEQHENVAIDGKALRGTGKQLYGGEEPQKQVLHVSEVHSGIVLQ